MKKVLFAACCATLLFTACKKENNDPDNNGNNNGNNNNNNNNNNNSVGFTTLTTGVWKMVSSTSVIEYPDPIGPQDVDLFTTMQNCTKDNLYTFKTDQTMLLDEGATKCNASDPQQKNVGNWQLTNNDTKLSMTDATGMNIVADVLTLSNSALKVKYVTNYAGVTSTTTTAYTKQ
jgi:hypothetical protein